MKTRAPQRLVDGHRLPARLLSLKLDGTPLAAATSNRYRTNCHDCVLAAVDADALPADPWPRRSRKHSSRKIARCKRAVDVRRLPAPETMSGKYRHPGSQTYQVMTATAYYAGLRPSEVIMLQLRSLTLPTSGWGRIDITETDIAWDEPGEPKTARGTSRSRRSSAARCASGLTRWLSKSPRGCCSAHGPGHDRASRRGDRRGTVRWRRSANPRCAYMTAVTQLRSVAKRALPGTSGSTPNPLVQGSNPWGRTA
jgi:hypothetical protein